MIYYIIVWRFNNNQTKQQWTKEITWNGDITGTRPWLIVEHPSDVVMEDITITTNTLQVVHHN